MGLSLLEEEQIKRIVDAARSLWKIGAGQDEDVGMYFRDTGNKAIYEDQYLAELDAALKRMGKWANCPLVRMYRIGEPIRAKTRLIVMKRKLTLGLEQSTVERAKAYAD